MAQVDLAVQTAAVVASIEIGYKQHEGAADAVCGGEQVIVSRSIIRADALWVREEGAVAGEDVADTQARWLVPGVAATEDDEAAVTGSAREDGGGAGAAFVSSWVLR
jgi:orotidine-5'-phosphate decarboxylase